MKYGKSIQFYYGKKECFKQPLKLTSPSKTGCHRENGIRFLWALTIFGPSRLESWCQSIKALILLLCYLDHSFDILIPQTYPNIFYSVFQFLQILQWSFCIIAIFMYWIKCASDLEYRILWFWEWFSIWLCGWQNERSGWITGSNRLKYLL